MKTIRHRKGKIIFNRGIIENLTLQATKLLFSNFYPFGIDNTFLFVGDKIEFYGFSEHFEESKEGYVIPEYTVIIHSDDKGKAKSIEFNKVN